MILNRLADAVRKQNWFTVTLEVLIVVVGIFIGLQVDDWNDRRKDRADERAYVARLHDDLLLAEALASRVRERRLALIADLATATDAIFDRTERENLTQAECTSIGDARFFNINISDLPALAELTGAGRLGLPQRGRPRRDPLNHGPRF